MMAYEFVLESPVLKEFDVLHHIEESYGVDEIDEETGEVTTVGKTRQVPVTQTDDLPADRIRLSSLHNDKDQERLFVRFIYGYVSSQGEWKPARLDDGMVVGGPNYHEVDIDLDGVIEENEVLAMCAKLLNWQGELVELPSPPQEGEAQA